MNKEIKDLESYHEGRHACRDKYKKSNLLVINPHIDIDSLTNSPCENCKEYDSRLKTMCGKSTTCKAKQLQLTAIEIKQHFKTADECKKTMGIGCLSCENFAFWDGDYCCVEKAEILSSACVDLCALYPNKVLNVNPMLCTSYSKAKDVVIEHNKMLWNTFNITNQVE